MGQFSLQKAHLNVSALDYMKVDIMFCCAAEGGCCLKGVGPGKLRNIETKSREGLVIYYVIFKENKYF